MEDFASSHFVITSIKIQIDALKKNVAPMTDFFLILLTLLIAPIR